MTVAHNEVLCFLPSLAPSSIVVVLWKLYSAERIMCLNKRRGFSKFSTGSTLYILISVRACLSSLVHVSSSSVDRKAIFHLQNCTHRITLDIRSLG